MEIISTKDFHIEGPSAVTIGKFDGIHMGHKKLLASCMVKKQMGFKICVFTFSPSPEAFFGSKEKCLTTVEEKRKLFAELGVDYLIEYPFDKETADMDPEDFICDILVARMNARFIAAGDDLSFGKGGKGNSELLLSLQEDYAYRAEIIDKVRIDNNIVSSTLVRSAVKEGKMEFVRELLGAPYQISGTIVHGNKVGRTIGMPTINQMPEEEKLLPPFGVYCSETIIDGNIYKGITNIGIKPTVSNDMKVGVETFLYNFNQDVYGNKADVKLYCFLRPEQKFNSVEELKEQMKKDIEAGSIFIIS